MNEKTKTGNANYTPEMEARLSEHYDPNADEETRGAQIVELAQEFGKNTQSVRAKLVRMGLYVKKEYKAKTGAKPVTKETIVSNIARTLGVDADAQLSGLEKATKNCLLFLDTTLRVASEAIAATQEEEH
jgi:hypothetical protein